MKLPDYYTIAEAAHRLQRSSRTVRRWVAQGHLLALRVDGRTHLLPRCVVDGFAPIKAGRPRKISAAS